MFPIRRRNNQGILCAAEPQNGKRYVRDRNSKANEGATSKRANFLSLPHNSLSWNRSAHRRRRRRRSPLPQTPEPTIHPPFTRLAFQRRLPTLHHLCRRPLSLRHRRTTGIPSSAIAIRRERGLRADLRRQAVRVEVGDGHARADAGGEFFDRRRRHRLRVVVVQDRDVHALAAGDGGVVGGDVVGRNVADVVAVVLFGGRDGGGVDPTGFDGGGALPGDGVFGASSGLVEGGVAVDVC